MLFYFFHLETLMDIPGNIGKHCTLPSCNELDFLPIKCTHCAQIYCKDHVFPDYHQCSSLSANTGSSSVSTEKLERCALDKCNKPSLESFISDRSADANRSPALCSHCQKSFCVECVLSILLTIRPGQVYEMSTATDTRLLMFVPLHNPQIAPRTKLRAHYWQSTSQPPRRPHPLHRPQLPNQKLRIQKS